MLVSLNRIFKKDVVKVFSLTAVSTIIKMITGFVSVKIVSTLIGPAGIALLGQLNNFSTIFLTFSTGGINMGITKYVAQYADSKDKVRLFLISGVWIAGLMSIISGITLIFGASFFSVLILHDLKYSSIIEIFGFTIIFYSFNSLLLAILNGFKEFKKFVFIGITSSLAGLIFTGTLAFFYGVYGALVSAVTLESIIFFITATVIAKSRVFRLGDFFGRFSKQAGNKLGNYALMALISAATVPVSQLIIRSNIVEYSSLADAGLWEAMNKLSAMYLLVITTSLSIYYLPRLSEIKSEGELRNEIFSAYKVIIPPLIVICSVIFLLRFYIIQFVFNDRFRGMEHLFAFQLIGDFFKISSLILAFQMLARSMTRYYIATEIAGSVIYVGLALVLIRSFGNLGATMGYAGTYIIYFVTMVLIFRKLIFAYGAK